MVAAVVGCAVFDLIQFFDSVNNVSDARLRRQIDAHVAALRASPAAGDRGWVAVRAELVD